MTLQYVRSITKKIPAKKMCGGSLVGGGTRKAGASVIEPVRSVIVFKSSIMSIRSFPSAIRTIPRLKMRRFLLASLQTVNPSSRLLTLLPTSKRVEVDTLRRIAIKAARPPPIELRPAQRIYHERSVLVPPSKHEQNHLCRTSKS